MIGRQSFIPAPRRARREAGRRRVLWAAINLATAAAGAAGALGARIVLLSDHSATSGAVEAARARLEEVTAERASLEADLRQVESRLAAHERATVHPDWSILLAYIARVGDGSISLDGFVLEPVGDGDSGRYSIALSGLATTQNAVTDFVLALEQSGVFSATDLVRSGRSQGIGFTFDVFCSIGKPATAEEETEEASG